MHLNSHLAKECKRLEQKTKRFSSGKRQYDVQYKVIEKKIIAALPIKTIHQLKPKNILFTSQHAPLKKEIEYQFLPTFSSRTSSSLKTSLLREGPSREVVGSAQRLKSRCQSAFSRTQTLKIANQERKAEKIFNSVGMMFQERGRKGEQVYTLNLLRIHGFSQKKIKFNNYFF